MPSTIRTQSLDLLGTPFTFESGRFAHQSQGALTLRYGDNVIFVSAMMSDKAPEGLDFFALTVDYEPKFYSSGKIKGSRFMKREARPPESAILTSRMTDRPLRPMFPKGIKNEVQIIAYLWQSDGLRSIAPMTITGASCACLMAGMPLEAPVSGVHVGRDANGQFILNPTHEEVKAYGLSLMVAGTTDAITMVEAGANLLTADEMLAGLEFAHQHIQALCQLQIDFVAQHEVTQREASLGDTGQDLTEQVQQALTATDIDSIQGETKKDIKAKMQAAEDKLLAHFAAQVEAEELSAKDLKKAMHKLYVRRMRERVFTEGKRIDGRSATEVRPLHVEVGLFERLHGCALFQRGETQSFSVLTLGSPSDFKLLDDADRPEFKQQYLHHYNFPPFSVGEIRRLRSPGRREIGHGALAQRALEPVLPYVEDNWPYFMRVVSEILTCNGSSSMASVCGSTLALMDGGVPIKEPIAGVAMGLMMDEATGDYRILTDIQGFEDFDGDMDLKVTGGREGITALQLDIKVKGLKIELLREALGQAHTARNEILDAMVAAIPESRSQMNEYAPRIDSFMIDPEDIRIVIGKGGETIQKIVADYEVKIDIEDSGLVMITSVNQSNADAAIAHIQSMLYKPEIGDIFEQAKVVKVTDFGAFVAYLPGKEALVHVSEMSEGHVASPSDVVSEGDIIRVKYKGSDKMGRMRLSMKGLN